MKVSARDKVKWMARLAKSAHGAVFSLACIGCVGILFFSISGCGNGLSQVSGVVTLDGQPLRGGSGDTRVTVQFQPASGTGSTSIGLADENGEYTLGTGAKTGIPPGEYLVSCSASQLVTARDVTTAAGARRITNPKYANAKTSGLNFTVAPGKNTYDIALVSPAGVSTNRRVP